MIKTWFFSHQFLLEFIGIPSQWVTDLKFLVNKEIQAVEVRFFHVNFVKWPDFYTFDFDTFWNHE